MRATERTYELLFPTVVQATMIGEREALNAQLTAEIEAVRKSTPNGRPESWSCDVYTTIGNNFMLHQRPGFRRLTELFTENAETYGRSLNYPIDKMGMVMDMCWVNAYRRGQSQERHTHINYIFGGIYFLKAPPGASKLMIHAPTSDTMMVPAYKQRTDLNAGYVEIEPEPGMMLIFSGNMLHSVSTSQIDDERISIAMNANLAQRKP